MTDESNQGTDRPLILARVADLFFASRIEVAAAHSGCRVEFIQSKDSGLQLMGAERAGTKAANEGGELPFGLINQAGLILVDLTQDGSVDWIARLKSTAGLHNVLTVAFGSHVDTETLQAARRAGADKAVARSRFVEILPALVAALAVE